MKQDIIEQIQATNLPAHIKTDLMNSLTERFLIEPRKSAINIGDSKIGGFPHLPMGFEYPQEENYYYEFVAQVNLSDLATCDIPGFPTSGMLYFFIDDEFNVADVKAKVIVHNTGIDGLAIKPPPEGKSSRCESFSDRTAFTELKLFISKSYTFGQKLLNRVADEQFTSGTGPTGNFEVEQFYTKNQIWGYTTAWSGVAAEWSAYLAKRRLSGLYWLTLDDQIAHLRKEQIDLKQWLHARVDEAIIKQQEILMKHDRAAYIYPYWERELLDLVYAKSQLDAFAENLDFHKTESKKWRMLLSLSSYQEAAISFGDGRMEFFINSDDLKSGNFDNIYCHIY
jgi:hypothetical protein